MPADIHGTALRMLARRALSRREIAQRLELKGFAAGAIRAELARLERVGLVDDSALAGAVARAHLGDGRGRRAVAATLRRRGVPVPAAQAAVAAIPEEEESEALARAFARAARRYPSFRRLPAVRRKVIRYLVARGFAMAAVLDGIASRAGEGADAVEAEVEQPEDP